MPASSEGHQILGHVRSIQNNHLATTYIDYIRSTTILINKYTQQPLHFFGSIGLATFIAGFFVELMILYYKFVLLEPFSKHIALLLLGVILIIIGIQFFSIGLLGEIIARFSQGKEDRIKDIK